MEFLIDTEGDTNLLNDNHQNNNEKKTIEVLKEFKKILTQKGKSLQIKEGTIKKNNEKLSESLLNNNTSLLDKYTKRDVNEIMKMSVITPGFEKLHAIHSYNISRLQMKKKRKEECALTKGSKWFNLPATELCNETKFDLEIIQMRSALDPKRFYKKNDMKILPKYFQIGKVMDSQVDFYTNRLTKKERKRTIVDELLNDPDFKKYNKKINEKISENKKTTDYRTWRQSKKQKK